MKYHAKLQSNTALRASFLASPIVLEFDLYAPDEEMARTRALTAFQGSTLQGLADLISLELVSEQMFEIIGYQSLLVHAGIAVDIDVLETVPESEVQTAIARNQFVLAGAVGYVVSARPEGWTAEAAAAKLAETRGASEPEPSA